MQGFEDEPREQPLIRTLERVLRIEGLKPKYLKAGIEANMVLHRHHDPDLVEILMQILGGGSVELAALQEALTRVIRGRLHGRPGVVFVDDVHAAPATLRWALHAKNASDFPVLIVLGTSRRPTVEGAEAVTLKPLMRNDFIRLCRSLLPTARRLEHQLFDRTGGLSGHCVDRVASLVRKEGLALDLEGYQASATLEFVSGDEWSQSIDLYELEPAVCEALVRAAALGVRVPHEVWASAHDDPRGELNAYEIPMASLLVRHQLLERLKHNGLAIEEGTHWRFSLARMPKMILAQAEDLGILRQGVSDTADALILHKTQHTRAARLLRRANRLQASLDVYLKSISLQAEQRTPGELPNLGAEECLELMDELGIAADDARRQWPHALRLTDAMNHPNVLAPLQATLEVAVRHGWTAVESLALAMLERVQPNGHLPRALALIEQSEPSECAGVARINVGIALRDQGHNIEALEVFEGLHLLSQQLGLRWFIDMAHINGAECLRNLGRPLGVDHCIEQARIAMDQGHIVSSAVWWINAAEEAYQAGDLEASERANLEALRCLAYTPSGSIIPLVNLALIAFELQDSGAMRGYLDQAWQEGRMHQLKGVFEMLEVCWASLINDPSTFENRLGRLEASPPHDPQSTALLLRVADGVPLPIWARRLRLLCETTG